MGGKRNRSNIHPGAELKALKGISDELFASIQYINTEASREAIYDKGSNVLIRFGPPGGGAMHFTCELCDVSK
jgi:hypothetical protein